MIDAIHQTFSRWPPSARWIASGVAGLWLLYATVFLASGAPTLPRAAITAGINVVPLACLAIAVQHLLRGLPRGLSTRRWVVIHASLAAGFSLIWYGAVLLGLAVLRGFETGQFALRGFEGPALSWQSFQGLCLYAVVAAVSYALRRDASAHSLPSSCPEVFLVKVDEGFIPVRVAEIVCVQGAHDYAHLTTRTGSHLVRHGLAEFGSRLDAGHFVRIHRSILVNLDHVQRAEAAGAGRMRVILDTGLVLTSSRAGAQLLRSMTL